MTGSGRFLAGSVLDEEDIRHPEKIRRAATITSGVALAHAALMLVAFFLVRRYGPGLDRSSEQFAQFWQSDRRQRLVLIAGIYLIPFAGITFIWFTVALRMWFQGRVTRIDALFHNLILICGVVYVCMLFAAGAALSLVALESTPQDPQTGAAVSATFARYGSSLFLIFALRMAAMIVFATTNLARRSDVFPKWFVYAGIPVGLVLLLTSSLDPLLVVVFPIWLSVLAIFLLLRGRQYSAAGTVDTVIPNAG